MPEIIRTPVRMDCAGIDVSHPVDRQPPSTFPLLDNVRVIEEGRIEGRPGYTLYGTAPPSPPFPTNKTFHTIRRLNDPNDSLAPTGYIDIVGNGAALDAGPQGALAIIDTGYSGNPLSLITFRPEQSTESWMYVYDKNKQIKVRPDAATRLIGVPPPTNAPKIDYGVPAWVEIHDGQTDTNWVATGIDTGPAVDDRTSGDVNTINVIIYDSGTTGWCCIQSNSNEPAWWGNRMQLVLNPGGGTQETVVVRETYPGVLSPTTIAGIQYDSGTTGLASVVLTGNPASLYRNSLLQFVGGGGTEIVRVQSVTLSPDGNAYSCRVNLAHNHVAGGTVNGEQSWRVYTINNHASGESYQANYVAFVHAAAGVGAGTYTPGATINASVANGRPIDIANDWMHISFYTQIISNVVDIQILINLNSTPNFSFTSPGNSYIWTVTQEQLLAAGSTALGWVDLLLPISQAVITGNSSGITLNAVTGLAIQMTSTGACNWGFDWWYFFGTYGPVIQPNSPVGYLYQTANRDSTIGAESVPSPQTRYDLFPLRESVIVTPLPTLTQGVDSLDIYRQGGTLTGFVYVGTVANNVPSPNSYTDGIPDTSILASPAPDLTKIQPWPLLDYEWVGTVNVVGTSIAYVSGQEFKPTLLSATVILINGVAYQTYGQPRNLLFLELFTDAGVQTNVPYLIASPTLAGQPLAYAFGPLEGPLAPVVFALGDTISGGNLYWSNFSDGDSADDANFLELTPPSEPLISGQVWNGIVICGSRDNIFLVRYSFVTNSVYQFNRIPSPSGMWTRWTTARGPDGVYFLGRDGIYLASEAGAKNITDGQLYPLFPHDGAPAVGSPSLAAVDMTQVGKFMRLSAGMFEIFFDYLDVNGAHNTLRFDIPKQRWFHHSYGDQIISHYLIDSAITLPSTPQMLLIGAASGNIYLAGGNDDDGVAIVSQAQVPYIDGGEDRGQKLYVDGVIDGDGTGALTATVSFNNGVTIFPTQNFTFAGSRVQQLLNIGALTPLPAGLNLYRNISCLFSWTGGPAGPRLYIWEPSGYIMPYLSTSIVTQFLSLDSPGGWVHHRRIFPALVSTADATFTIKTQDGRSYTVTIPSTNGQLRTVPLMAPQGIKDTLLAYSLTCPQPFALFTSDFAIETKIWIEPSYLNLAIWKV